MLKMTFHSKDCWPSTQKIATRPLNQNSRQSESPPDGEISEFRRQPRLENIFSSVLLDFIAGEIWECYLCPACVLDFLFFRLWATKIHFGILAAFPRARRFESFISSTHVASINYSSALDYMTQMDGDDADPATWRKEFAIWKSFVQIAMEVVDVTNANCHRQCIC